MEIKRAAKTEQPQCEDWERKGNEQMNSSEGVTE